MTAGRPRRPRPRRGARDGAWQPGPRPWLARVEAAGKNASTHPKGGLWERIKAHILQRDHYKCVVCGHFGGPKSGMGIDHVIPLSECAVQGIAPFDQRNLACIHHSKPCAECQAAALALGNKAGFCNAMKGAGSLERARQLVANRTGLTVYGVAPDAGKPRRTAVEPVTGERPW